MQPDEESVPRSEFAMEREQHQFRVEQEKQTDLI